jgi:large conductance mechanosensitive channel
VAVVIGVAFNTVIQALIADIITPLIAAIGGKPNFSSLSFTINKSHFLYGSFFNALISFVIITAVVYYLIISPAAKITDLTTRQKEATERDCPSASAASPSRPSGACTAPRKCRRSRRRSWSRPTSPPSQPGDQVYGVVRARQAKPSRSRIGLLSGEASTCKYLYPRAAASRARYATSAR